MRNTIISTIKGKAYEYACLIQVYKMVNLHRKVEIENNVSYEIAKRYFYDKISVEEQNEMLLSAKTGVSAIIEMEPKIIEDGSDMLSLCLQPDNVARNNNDIRDVLIIRRNIKWEIGISVKHNHAALKHSRLSKELDFGKIWLNSPCSVEYFNKIQPIFQLLKAYKDNNVKWSDLQNKYEQVYVPILCAFRDEFNKINKNKRCLKNLIVYLLGSNGKDYYKLIHNNDRTTTVIPFNFRGTLNTSSRGNKPTIQIKPIKLPTRIIEFEFKANSKTTLVLTLDNGWAVSFRLHNASTFVEPSLKFDINLVGQPADMFYIKRTW